MSEERKRRDKGTGSVYYVESLQKWQAKITIKGRPHTKTADTEKEAKRLLREMIRKQETLADQSKKKYNVTTFEDYARTWLENIKKNELAGSSFRTLSYDMEHYVFPTLGLYIISQITSSDVQEWIQSLVKQKRALSTIKRLKSSVSSCMNYAVKKYDIPFNPCRDVVMPTKRAYPELKKNPICVLSADEVQRFVAQATSCWPNGTPKYKYGWGLVFVLASGIRREEATPFEWTGFNEKQKVARIWKVASYVEDDSGEHNQKQVIVEMTKSDASERVLPLNGSAVDALEHQRRYTGSSRYVFDVSKTKPVDMNSLGRSCHRIMAAAGIMRPEGVKTGMHALRHTFCSNLIMADPPMDIKTISEIMGHSDTRITLDTYGHIFDERKKRAVEIADFIKKKDNANGGGE